MELLKIFSYSRLNLIQLRIFSYYFLFILHASCLTKGNVCTTEKVCMVVLYLLMFYDRCPYSKALLSITFFLNVGNMCVNSIHSNANIAERV